MSPRVITSADSSSLTTSTVMFDAGGGFASAAISAGERICEPKNHPSPAANTTAPITPASMTFLLMDGAYTKVSFAAGCGAEMSTTLCLADLLQGFPVGGDEIRLILLRDLLIGLPIVATALEVGYREVDLLLLQRGQGLLV